MKIAQVEKDRKQLASDLLDQSKLKQEIQKIRDKLEMEKEDLLAQVMRKNDKIIREREETRQFRDEILKQKQEWSDVFESKQKQLARLTEEKSEELNMMELALRHQHSEVKQREEQLEIKQAELKKQKEAQLQEIEQQKEAIIEERRWLESVREDLDTKMDSTKSKQLKNNRSSSKGS